jgi:hypothetical protein
MRVSEDQLADILKRTGVKGAANTADVSRPPFLPAPVCEPWCKLLLDRAQGGGPCNCGGIEKFRNRPIPAFGRLGPSRKMNKTEAAYDAHLRSLRDRLYVWHLFEGITLKIANDTRYTPDFAVQTVSGQIELHEVKGFWREDAKIKIKVAAEMFPFRFIAVKRDGLSWTTEEF